MEKIISKHLFFDGYSIEQRELENVGKVNIFLDNLNNLFFDSKGKIVLIPYFNGKIKEDGGISGIILGDNKHFTIHTFCYKNTMFIDYFGAEEPNEKEKMKETILKEFVTDDYDLCDTNNRIQGKFGKHIIIKPNNIITYEEAKKLVEQILKDISDKPSLPPIQSNTLKYEYIILPQKE